MVYPINYNVKIMPFYYVMVKCINTCNFFSTVIQNQRFFTPADGVAEHI